MDKDDFDLYDNEEQQLNACIMKEEDEYEQMKDRVHDLYDENQRLKNRLNNHPMNNVYIKKEDVNKWIGKYFPNQDLISIDDLIGCIEDLDGELEHIKEEFEDYKENVSENYRPIDQASQYGVSESWFH